MPAISPIRISAPSRWVSVLALTAAILLASAASARAAGELYGFTFTPSSTQAGGSPSITTTMSFSYQTASETLSSIDFLLPPGMFLAPGAAPATCTTAELSTNSCPSGSQIGTGQASFAGPENITVSLFAMPAPTTNDEAGFGIAFPSPVNGTLGATATGTIDLTTANAGVPQQLLAISQLPGFFAVPGTSVQAGQLNSLSLTVNATSASGAGLTRMPTTCGDGTVFVVANSSAYNDSNASATVTPTGCSSLAFTPTLTATAKKDTTDSGAAILSTIEEPIGQAAAKALSLTFPGSMVANASAASKLCSTPNATFSNCSSIGSVAANTPLLSAPLSGSIYLTGASSGPQLTIAFGPPFAFTASGGFGPSQNTANLTLPDVPLTQLQLYLDGGTDALYTTTCEPASVTEMATLGDQSADKSVSPTSSFTIGNCSPSSTTPPTKTKTVTQGKPTLTAVRFSGLTGHKPKVTFTLAAGTDAPNLSSFTVRLPSGVSFHKRGLKHGVAITGGTLKRAKLTGGKLVITLKHSARRVKVRIASGALKVTRSLAKKVRTHKTKKLKLTVTATDADGTTTTRTSTAQA